MSRLGHEGLLRKVVAGNWGRMPSVCQLALDEKIYAYNLPQGIIAQLFRDLAGGKPGTFSKIGLHTFVDPRHEGGHINKITTRDIVKLVEFEGDEWLFYKVAPVTVAFIRGTTADPPTPRVAAWRSLIRLNDAKRRSLAQMLPTR